VWCVIVVFFGGKCNFGNGVFFFCLVGCFLTFPKGGGGGGRPCLETTVNSS